MENKKIEQSTEFHNIYKVTRPMHQEGGLVPTDVSQKLANLIKYGWHLRKELTEIFLIGTTTTTTFFSNVLRFMEFQEKG